MKLEIELDLNKIDYEAINKQIQEKIADMDLEKAYQISCKINNKITEKVEEKVNQHLGYAHWSGLNENSRRGINDEISKNVRELIKPHVENIFSQIPQEELDKIIGDLIPELLLDTISSNINTIIANYYCNAEARTRKICEERIHSILNR